MNMRYALRDFGNYVEDRATTLNWSAASGLKINCSCDVCQSLWWKPIQFLFNLHPAVRTWNASCDEDWAADDWDVPYDTVCATYQVRITEWLMQKSHGFSSWCDSFYTQKTVWYFEYDCDERGRTYYEASERDCLLHVTANALETNTATLIPLPRDEDVDVSNLPPNILLYYTKPQGFEHLDHDEVWVTDKYLERTLHHYVEYV